MTPNNNGLDQRAVVTTAADQTAKNWAGFTSDASMMEVGETCAALGRLGLDVVNHSSSVVGQHPTGALILCVTLLVRKQGVKLVS